MHELITVRGQETTKLSAFRFPQVDEKRVRQTNLNYSRFGINEDIKHRYIDAARLTQIASVNVFISLNAMHVTLAACEYTEV